MKKGLRQEMRKDFSFHFHSETSPDEEGIKTLAVGQARAGPPIRRQALMKKGLRLWRRDSFPVTR